MSAEIGKKIRDLRRALGESQAMFGDRFGVEQATVSRWERGEPVQRRLEDKIATLAGMSVVEFFHSKDQPRLIPIVGEISAGESFSPIDDYLPGAQPDHITLSLGDQPQIALRVRGSSMSPVYRDGDVIIGAKLTGPAMARAVGRDCVVKTSAGEGYLKVLRRGASKGRYTLRSYNPAFDDLEDVALEWAAPVLWVRRAL